MNTRSAGSILRRSSSLLLGRPSRVLQEINSNALLVQWSRTHQTDSVVADRSQLYEFVHSHILNSHPIDFLEFGVYKGDSLFEWARLNKNSESRFYGFDTFEGLPEPWQDVRRFLDKGFFSTDGKIPETADTRIQFVKGLFQESLPDFLRQFRPRSRIVMHCDADLYSSTLFCLTQIDAILSKGSVLMFDEFYSSSNEFQAFFDYTRAYRRDCRVLTAVGRNPYVRIAMEME